VVAGVGSTDVITIGQLLGMAAHLEGKGVVTQDSAGLAQKGGATWSHVQIANRPDTIHSTKVDTAKADLVIACDAIVAAGASTLQVTHPGHTFVAMNSHRTPTAAFVGNPDWQFPGERCESALLQAVGADKLGSFDAEQVALQLLGDSIYTNPLMLGYAWQRGQIPLSRAALLRAIELNGVQVEKNRAAFEWGRRCAHDLAGVQSLFSAQQVIQIVKRPSLDELVSRRVEFLTGYQNAAYAAQYRDFVQTVRDAEQRVLAGGSGSTQLKLSEAVARYLFKLMAYKDEYEVARLHSDAAFHARLAEMFEGDFKIVHHLAPPKIATTDREGHLVKRRFGPWLNRALPWLAKLKALRGTALDPFGGTAERRTERALIAEYRATVEELLAGLSLDQLAQAVEIARLPEDIRGYGHVKERHLAAVRQRWGGLLAAWRSASRPSQAR